MIRCTGCDEILEAQDPVYCHEDYMLADKEYHQQRDRADKAEAKLAASDALYKAVIDDLKAKLAEAKDQLAQAEYANEGLRDSKGMQDYYKRELKAALALVAVLVEALEDATEHLADCISYKSDYLVMKHGDREALQRARDALKAMA